METVLQIAIPECPTCLNPYTPNRTCFIICTNGHSVCGACKRNPKRGGKCPVCRVPDLPSGGVPCRDMMKMIVDLQKSTSSSTSLSPQNEGLKDFATEDMYNELKRFCEGGDVEGVQNLVVKNDFSNFIQKEGDRYSILERAIYNGQYDIVCLLLQHTVYFLESSPRAIYLATINMDIELVQVLLDNDEDDLLSNRLQKAFEYACENGYIDIVKKLIHRNVNVNSSADGDNNESLLSSAAFHGYDDIVNELLSHGADINAKDTLNETALIYACKAGNMSTVNLLLSHPHVDIRGSALPTACKLGHLNIVKLLLQKGIDVHARDKSLRTGLIWACEAGHAEIVRELLQYNADIKLDDLNRNTPLIQACRRGHIDIVKILLDHPLSNEMIDMTDIHDDSAITIASMKGFFNIVKLLIDKKASLEAGSPSKLPPLYKACESEQYKVIELLFDTLASSPKKEVAYTIIYQAAYIFGHINLLQLLVDKGMKDIIVNDTLSFLEVCSHGHTPIVEMLLDLGINLQSRDETENTALIVASEAGHSTIVQLLVEKGMNIDDTYIGGKTALMYACVKGHIDIVRYLISCEADLTIRDQCDKTAFHHACAEGHYDVIRLFIQEYQYQQNELDNSMSLFQACQGGYVDIIRLLLDSGISINTVDEKGVTTLMRACVESHNKVVKLLIEKGADIHMISNNGNTALHYACCKTLFSNKTGGKNDIVKLLLDKGALMDIKAHSEYTPLLYACYNGLFDVMKTLLDHGATMNENVRDQNGNTAPMLMVKRHTNIEFINYLLSHHPHDINQTNHNGDSLLILACENSDVNADMINILLDASIDVNIQNRQGETALMVISKKGQTHLVRVLLQHSNIDVNLQDKSGETALMKAAFDGELNTVIALVEKDAKIDIMNNEGKTAIMLADGRGCVYGNYRGVRRYLTYKLKLSNPVNAVASGSSDNHVNNSNMSHMETDVARDNYLEGDNNNNNNNIGNSSSSNSSDHDDGSDDMEDESALQRRRRSSKRRRST